MNNDNDFWRARLAEVEAMMAGYSWYADPTIPVPSERWDDFKVGTMVETVGTVNRHKGRIGRIVHIIWRPDLPKAGNTHIQREYVVEWLRDDKSETHPSGSVFTTHSGLALKHYDDGNQ